MKYSMMLGFQFFSGLNPAAFSLASREAVATGASASSAVWPSSVRSGPLRSIYNPNPGLAGQHIFSCTSLQVLKEGFLKMVQPCTPAQSIKWAFIEMGSTFLSIHPKALRTKAGHLLTGQLSSRISPVVMCGIQWRALIHCWRLCITNDEIINHKIKKKV